MLAGNGVATYSHLIETDCREQYGRRENFRIFGVPEEEDEDPYEELRKVAAKVEITIYKEDIRTLVAISKSWSRPLIAKVVRRESKSRVMAKKKALKFEDDSKEPIIFVSNHMNASEIIRAIIDKPGPKE